MILPHDANPKPDGIFGKDSCTEPRRSPNSGPPAELEGQDQTPARKRNMSSICLKKPVHFLAACCVACVLAIPSAAAPRTKSKTAASTAGQSSVPTDRVPANKNQCAAIARTLNDRVKTLARTTRRAIPQEFTQVASDLRQSCNAENFAKARISIEWMNGCLEHFTKNAELGFCSKNEGYFCAVYPESENCLGNR
jgi:hypothetical protein